jgi:hypothetical protein
MMRDAKRHYLLACSRFLPRQRRMDRRGHGSCRQDLALFHRNRIKSLHQRNPTTLGHSAILQSAAPKSRNGNQYSTVAVVSSKNQEILSGYYMPQHVTHKFVKAVTIGTTSCSFANKVTMRVALSPMTANFFVMTRIIASDDHTFVRALRSYFAGRIDWLDALDASGWGCVSFFPGAPICKRGLIRKCKGFVHCLAIKRKTGIRES